MLLDVTDATYTYRRRTEPAVSKVSLRLDRGEIVAVVGESGSGKSTLARLIAGLLRPDAGTVSLEGTVLSPRRTREQRRAIQMVFQDPRSSLNPRLTTTQIVDEAWQSHQTVRPPDLSRALAELLDVVGLDHAMAGKRSAEMSGGQAQRVSIARALAVRPRVLVCDEAVSALDVSVQTQILALLLRLRDTLGIAIVFITHDLGVVRQIADRVAVMYRGAVVEQGATEPVFTAPKADYTRSLLDAALDLAAR